MHIFLLNFSWFSLLWFYFLYDEWEAKQRWYQVCSWIQLNKRMIMREGAFKGKKKQVINAPGFFFFISFAAQIHVLFENYGFCKRKTKMQACCILFTILYYIVPWLRLFTNYPYIHALAKWAKKITIIEFHIDVH